MRRLEEAERNAQIAEAKIAERDQRITEVERLLNCMAQVNNISWLSLCLLPWRKLFIQHVSLYNRKRVTWLKIFVNVNNAYVVWTKLTMQIKLWPNSKTCNVYLQYNTFAAETSGDGMFSVIQDGFSGQLKIYNNQRP